MTEISSVLAELLAQHDLLRTMMARCDELVDALDDDAAAATELAVAVRELRVLFEAHNVLEEAILRPVLIEADAFGPVRVARMLEAHLGEHRTFAAQLATASAHELRQVLATLCQHLAEEERYFLRSTVLRDDLVTVESSS